MSQNDFFNILMDGLKDLPEAQLRDIISYYDNKFTHGLTLGKPEEEIIAQLGNPNLIVNQYRSEFLDTITNSEPFNNTDMKTESFNTEKLNYDFSSDDTTDTKKNKINTITTPSTNAINTNNNSDISDNIIDNDPNSTGSVNNSKIITNNETLSIPNTFDHISSDFTINDNSNNEENTQKNNDTVSEVKASIPPYGDINSNNNFYDLYNSNPSVESKDVNHENNKSYNSTYGYNHDNSNYKKSHSTVNTILKFCIVGVTLLIFSPVITGILTCIIGLFGVAISILIGSIGLLVGGTFTSFIGVPNLPAFVANFPYPVIVLFSLGSISLSLFLTLVFYYLCKFFVRLLIKTYRLLKLKGGDM